MSFSEVEYMLKQAECRQKSYDKKIVDLQNTLESTVMQHDEERKAILQKLYEEKSENMKNKTQITRLNECIQKKILNEKNLKECAEKFSEDIEILKCVNEDLKSEICARKKIMTSIQTEDNLNLTEMEELICQLKIRKAEFKSKYYNLREELHKEVEAKRFFESQVEDLNLLMKSQLEEVHRKLNWFFHLFSECVNSLFTYFQIFNNKKLLLFVYR